MKEIGVKSIGWYLPEKRLINEDLEGMADTTGQWIVTRTGIQERRIAGKHITTSAMAVRAARAALETAALQPAELDYIISSTSTHEYACPPQDALVGQGLGVQKGFCFDLNAALLEW